MTPGLDIKISTDLLDRLQHVHESSVGSLFGHIFNGTLVIVGFSLHEDAIHRTPGCDTAFLQQLPAEVELCGVVKFGAKVDDEKVETFLQDMVQDVDVTDNPVLLTVLDQTPLLKAQAYFYLHQKLEAVSYKEITPAQIASTFLHVRLKGQLQLCAELTLAAMSEAFQTLHKKIAADTMAFQFQEHQLLVTSEDGEEPVNLEGIPSGDTTNKKGKSAKSYKVCDLLDLPSSGRENCKGKSSASSTPLEILSALVLLRQSRDQNDVSGANTAPVIHHVKSLFQCCKMPLKIDTLALVHRNTKVSALYNILVSALTRNLNALERCLLSQLKSEGKDKLSIPEPFHFLPSGCGHFVSVVYPKKVLDVDLLPVREQLHLRLALPRDRPLFRRSNKYIFESEQENNKNGILINPHEGLNPSGVKDGEVFLVKGKYSYHHYMQDRMDDNGWGCAYRSMQTVVSWFRHQGFTDVPVPSHKDIQQCLVDIGDKPPAFVGSRQWIGSTEISFVLTTLLGIQSRIVNASNGAEVGALAPELALHFQRYGTPIMIGGGVLAHTILGVDYNRLSGEVKFLILDPHYTGAEDLNIIQSKGWCGWKDVSFWSKTAFYNLCLPYPPLGSI